jgi:recombination protein RecA
MATKKSRKRKAELFVLGDDPQEEIARLSEGINKRRGSGIGTLRGANAIRTGDYVDVISTGSLKIDEASGIGGLPLGRIVEIYGPEASGKTTLTLHTIVNAQAKGYLCAFVDAEHAFDPTYAEALGMDLEQLLFDQPECGEDALDVVLDLASSGKVHVIVIDSVAALTPRAELDGDMGDQQVGLQARMMSKAMRKLTSIARNNNVLVIFINQLRMKIGVKFGSPETTTGGNALKFYASMRLDIRRIGAVKKPGGDAATGNRTKLTFKKNKLAPPFRVGEFDIIYGQGIDLCGELLDYALEEGVIQRSGTWYSHGEERLGQGREKARHCIAEDGDLQEKLLTLARGKSARG